MNSNNFDLHIAFFVTSHGFGHAARAASIMQAMGTRNPSLSFEIFTTVPPWFFDESLTTSFRVHEVVTDVGLVQASSLEEDIPATVKCLDHFLPFHGDGFDDLCRKVKEHDCCCILCDIAPLGISVAHHVGIPSVLIENFTWNWIYQGYVDLDERLRPHMDYLENIFARADLHVQTVPVCRSLPVDFTAAPAGRIPRQSRRDVRQKLKIPDNHSMILITMGGITESYGFIKKLEQHPDVSFVIPGGADTLIHHTNITLIPQHSDMYHPDLIHAADAVIGKAGYSTVAEVFHAGIPFGYVPRPRFPESDTLCRFIEENMPCMAIDPERFRSGDWLPDIDRLIDSQRVKRKGPNGADQVADFILAQPFLKH